MVRPTLSRIGALALALIAAACHRGVPDAAPPRATGGIAVPPQTSTIAVPIAADLDALAGTLGKAVPRTLWTIDKPGQTCVPPTQVKILFAKVRTPTVTCRIAGTVTRGALALSGHGREIVIDMPIHAVVSASEVGHSAAHKTATADAHVRAIATLDLGADWTPRGTVRIRYEWVDAPHVDILGQRIEFADKADAKLAKVVDDLERTLPTELAKLDVRAKADRAWRAAFTAIALNRGDPPVWLRITPRAIGYGGYAIARHILTLRLGMTARTETFIGPRPADPPPTPLPPLGRGADAGGRVTFALPVIASYAQLEPVLLRALARRSQRPFAVPGIGDVTARFGKVTVYGTTGGRIAVGLAFDAAAAGHAPAHGTVWLTALPVNAPDSRAISFANVAVGGLTDSTGANLLLGLANAPGLSGAIAGALGQNFGADYDRLLAKVGHAIAEKKVAGLTIRARLDTVHTGRLRATGQGVYLPVSGTGVAAIALE